MKTFKQLISEGIRQGLPHITTMDHKQFGDLIGKGRISFQDVTEKTDGSAHKFGYDEHGFYSQYTGSGNEKMRSPQDFIDRAKRRSAETGRPLDLSPANTFGHIHTVLHSNSALQDHLRKHFEKTGKEVQVQGEIFYRPNGKPSDVPGEVKFVGTSYDPSHMGSVGKYVIHSKLPQNQGHDIEKFKRQLSDSNINFDDDKTDVKPSKIDVSEHAKAYNRLNHELLNSRTTKTNKESKERETSELESIKKAVSDKVDEHIGKMNLTPRWGSGSEGLVVHPVDNQPRFKVTSPNFREYRASDASKKNFKARFVKEAVRIILEGGNIKIGSVSAAPFKITNRSEQTNDIHNALSEIHDSFHEETGEHLFGKNKRALRTGSTFAGSTRQLMDKSISDEEFTKHKPTVGDIDVQVTRDHKDTLGDHLTPGRKFGRYTVIGTKKHGTEISAVMRHDNGEHHQFDFEGVEYRDHEPTKGEQFLHSSNWEDARAGIKGAHHKILLNATGLDTHKFSITHGLRSRTDEKDIGQKEPEGVTKRLFGPKADSSRITSFHGVADLIRQHLPKEEHQRIYDKFKDSISNAKMTGSDSALSVLRTKLNIKYSINEEKTSKTHAHISFLAAVPFTHMGHHQDIIGSMNSAPNGPKFVGLSGKSSAFSDKEREDIANKQSGGQAEFKVEKSPGFAIARAYDAIQNSKGHKVLHLHFGHDRKSFAEGLKESVESGKIPELQGNRFDRVEIHYPEDTDRSHGMSGTKMRKAAAEDDLTEFHKHIGSNFNKNEAKKLMDRVKKGIDSGSIPFLRESNIVDKMISFKKRIYDMELVEESSEHKKKTVRQIRKTLKEKLDPMIEFRKKKDSLRLVPSRSGSKGGDGGSGGGSGNGNSFKQFISPDLQYVTDKELEDAKKYLNPNKTAEEKKKMN